MGFFRNRNALAADSVRLMIPILSDIIVAFTPAHTPCPRSSLSHAHSFMAFFFFTPIYFLTSYLNTYLLPYFLLTYFVVVGHVQNKNERDVLESLGEKKKIFQLQDSTSSEVSVMERIVR
jgi:hypothetical protein